MTLKVIGTNFPTQAAILWNGAALTTTVVDANTLSGSIGSSSLANPGTAQLQVQNTETMQASKAVQVVVTSGDAGTPSPLTISITSLPQGVVNAPYSGTFTVSGGTAPYTWSVASGQLPPGLNLAAGTGILSGTPTSSGNYSFAVTITDSGSSVQSATTTVTLPVVAPPVTLTPLTINSTALPSVTIGSAYSTVLQATGGTAPYTWSFTGSLPAGLSLATTTGIISGIPTSTGTYNFTATAVDSANPAQTKSIPYSLVVAPVSLAITTSTLPSGPFGSAYSTLLQAGGGTAPYTWSITAGNLPSGLNLAATSGIISGTPTTSGTFNFTVTVTDAGSPAQTRSVPLSIVIAAVPLTINTSVLPSGTQGSGYSSALQASGGSAPYTWSLTSGALPAGLSLAATGIVAGTPTTSGNFTIGVTAKDAGSPSQTTTATVTFSIVAAGTPLAINSTTLPGGTPNQAYSAALNATGGTAPYTWSVTAGTLPTGLSFAPATGIISGTPTASSTASLTFNVTDSSSPAQAKSVGLSLVVAAVPLALTTSSLPSGMKGTAYSNLLQASGGTPAYTWSITVGSLPAGLTLAPTTGLISGTPTASGTSNFTATITDAGSPAQTKSVALSLVVAAAPALTINAALPFATAGTAYSGPMSATGGTPAYTWSITAGSLPAGLTLAATTGIISGTPSTSGTYSFTTTVSDNSTPAQTTSAVTSISVGTTAPSGPGTTWYVRSDGGTRWSPTVTSGQCNGTANAPYSGTGVNQPCAFNDMRYLWTDGSFCNDGSSNSTCWTWIGAGGDTYIVRDCIQYSTASPFPAIPGSSGSCRIGQQGPGSSDWGISLAGDPNNSGWPIPHNGTSGAHTKIMGANFGSCSAQSAKTLVNGGYATGAVFKMQSTSYVDVACFDITDFSSCGRSNQLNACSTVPGSLSDFAGEGIQWSNTSTNDTVTNVRIHGMASLGMFGPTGDGVVMNGLEIIGNAGAGWNADAGDGTTGVGSLLVQNYNISWNGCAEEYPIVDALPYQDCTDDNIGGYGDGFGTATVTSQSPGWQAHFDQGVVSYNTQDGLDALHLIGSGSSMTITRTLAYGNMGQQIKVGGASGTAANNVIFTSCNAMRQAIPGTPAGYNTRLSDFCRAADSGVVVTVGKGTMLTFDFNTIYSASATGIEVDCDTSGGACDSTSLIDFRNNIFVGFLNNPTNGYPGGGTGDYSNPIYIGANINPFTNAGSLYTNNLTYNGKSNWVCPAQWLNEASALCMNPNLTDQTWHLYGFGNVAPLPSVKVVQGSGITIPAFSIDYTGQARTNPPSIGAYN